MATVEEILAEARKLPPEEQHQLASALLTEAERHDQEEAGIHAALAIVEETSGTIKGLDRETIIVAEVLHRRMVAEAFSKGLISANKPYRSSKPTRTSIRG